MNNSHISALSLALLIFALQALAYFGWGKVTARLLGLQKHESTQVTLFIWIGWAVSLLLFQGINLLFPLTAVVVVPVFLLGIGLAVQQFSASFRRHTLQPSMLKRLLFLGLVVGALAVSGWVASRSMLPPTNYDSGLYHFNKIRWINSFPIVPGLGNLHGRLAFNQSFFTYVGALNFHPFFGHGRSVANSFLFLLTTATFIELSSPLFKRPSLLIKSHPFQYLQIIFLFPVLGILAFYSNGLSSPSPDLTSTLLQLTIFVVFAQGLGEWRSGQVDQNCKIIFLVVLATTAVTIKLSNLAFASAIIGLSLLYTKGHSTACVTNRVVVFSAIITLVWCLQSILLSGAPLFPSTLGYLPVDWAVPIEKVELEAKLVYAWARQPDLHWSKVLSSWDWFTPWLDRLLERNAQHRVVIPLSISVVFLIATSMTFLLKNGIRTRHLEWSILLPPALGLIFWFCTAPDPRFANGIFFILPVCSTLFFLASIQDKASSRTFILLTLLVFLVVNYKIGPRLVASRGAIKYVSTSGWNPVKEAPLNKKTTSSGLSVFVPKVGNQCWDSPLPSTPRFNADLRLRRSDMLPSGFTVTEKKE